MFLLLESKERFFRSPLGWGDAVSTAHAGAHSRRRLGSKARKIIVRHLEAGTQKSDPGKPSGRQTTPLVRIDHRKGKQAAYREAISRMVHEALVSVGAPKDQRFQVIAEHDVENLVFDLNSTSAAPIIQITWNEGRTVEQKKALYKAIADGRAAALSLRREHVFIGLVEVRGENWSFGNGVTQYA